MTAPEPDMHATIRQLRERIAELENPWRPISEAPEDESVILATTGGWVCEAILLPDDDEKLIWHWASGGTVHENHKPLAWMPLPTPPEGTP